MTHPGLDALLEAMRLKALPRAGWVLRGVPSPESVAAHTWGVSWLAVVLCPDDLDREKVLTYATLHDLPEVRVGDLTPHDGVAAADKAALEAEALDALTATLPPAVAARWHAYEAQADAEARFVKQLDRLDMALQAVAYAEAGAEGMAEFLDSAAAWIDHPALVPLLRAARERLER